MFAEITLSDVILVAAAAVAIIGLVLALLTPKGRDTVALLGLRVADALVSLIEKLLSDPALLTRLDTRIDKDMDRACLLDKAFIDAIGDAVQETQGRDGCLNVDIASIDLDKVFEKFRNDRREAERELFKDVLWQTFTGDDRAE